MGFDRIEVVERTPFSIDDAAHYPLFTPEVIGLMHELLDPAHKAQVAMAITVRAEKPRLRKHRDRLAGKPMVVKT